MKSYTTVYPHDEVYDILASTSFYGMYHVFAFKKKSSEALIDRSKLEIGEHVFEVSRKYTNFGKQTKKSAGFVHYIGEALEFVGVYKNNALFVQEFGPMQFDEYPSCFWSWKYSIEHKMFLSMTAQSSSRRMDM